MKIFYLISIFFFVNYKAQNSFDLLIQYDYKWSDMEFDAFLLSCNKENVFFYTNDKQNLDYEKIVKDFSFRKINSNFLFFYDQSFGTTYQFNRLYSEDDPKLNSKLSKDKFVSPEWIINNEYKEILGYNCQKATTTFRGRQWTVWFTTTISGNAFPWKLKGLPGAILEAKDIENMFSMTATRVVENLKLYSPKELVAFFEKYSPSAIDYKDFIDKENIQFKDNQNKLIADYPAGTVFLEIPHYREGFLEKTFEWELEAKKP